jgi:hypothetical protein
MYPCEYGTCGRGTIGGPPFRGSGICGTGMECVRSGDETTGGIGIDPCRACCRSGEGGMGGGPAGDGCCGGIATDGRETGTGRG